MILGLAARLAEHVAEDAQWRLTSRLSDLARPTEGRACLRCGRRRDGPQLSGGVDPCLGVLPGVYAACCGHGFARHAYVWIREDGWPSDRLERGTLRGRDALAWFDRHLVGPEHVSYRGLWMGAQTYERPVYPMANEFRLFAEQWSAEGGVQFIPGHSHDFERARILRPESQHVGHLDME